MRTIQGLEAQKSQGKFTPVDPSLVESSNLRRTTETEKPYSGSKKGSAPKTHEWGENADCTLRIAHGEQSNPANVEAAERVLASIEKDQDLMTKMSLRPSDVRKVRDRIGQSLPNDLQLRASNIAGTGSKCGICAKIEWGKRLHRALKCQNCETHEDGSCHMSVAAELFTNSDLVRRISEMFWFRLVSALYPRRPRWGKQKSKDVTS